MASPPARYAVQNPNVPWLQETRQQYNNGEFGLPASLRARPRLSPGEKELAGAARPARYSPWKRGAAAEAASIKRDREDSPLSPPPRLFLPFQALEFTSFLIRFQVSYCIQDR